MRFHPASARSASLTVLAAVGERFIVHAPALAVPLVQVSPLSSPPRRLCLVARAAGLTLAAALAVASAALGLIVERWLFFAEAKHTVTLYYGAAAV